MDFKNASELLALCTQQQLPISEIMRRREGLELGGVRPPLPGLAAGDSPKVDQCARMIDEAIETYCK
mgnify:CR=1 FL=1